MTPNKKLIRKWINRLRHPSSRQARNGMLANGKGGYCCLGHACFIADPKGKFNDICSVHGNVAVDSYLPEEYSATLGISVNPYLNIPKHLRRKFENATDSKYGPCNCKAVASDLNDELGFNLKEIADCIEYTYFGRVRKPYIKGKRKVVLEQS